VLGALYALRQQPERVTWLGGVPDFTEGTQLLARHAAALLGPPPAARPVRIMVTMPSEAADDYALVRKLLQRGMDCMRVNCAHDDDAAWMQMIEHLERARLEIGRPCAVQMDLGGPKIRTGDIEPGPAVLKVKPVRDRLGAVVRPAVLGLVAVGAATPAVVGIDVTVPVDRVPAAAPGDRLWFEDAQGRRRSMRVRHAAPGVLVVDVDRTAYILPGTRIQGAEGGPHCVVAELPPTPGQIILRRGDVLRLLRRAGPGRAAATDGAGRSLSMAEIGITEAAIFDDLEPGHHVWLDDGKIGAVVRAVHVDGADVEVVMAAAGGSSLKAGKGVNLPDTVVSLPALTAVDLQHLDFVACHADLVGYSFVRSADDVLRLQAELAKRVPELERIRLDADSASKPGALREALDRFVAADRAVLIGTQMVAKGHHFPGVSLAAVVDADTGLALPDFRADERTFQLVTQLAGRSGRDAPGKVIVQTFQPDATPLRYAARHDVAGFLGEELSRRRELGYPPFRHLISIVASGADAEAPSRLLRELNTELTGADLLGPAPLLAECRPAARVSGLFACELYVHRTDKRPRRRDLE
jgi:hypothetical protein